MRSYQRYENSTRHGTDHAGGGSDHELARLFSWLVVLAIAVALFLYINGSISLWIDKLVWFILGG